MTTTEKIEAIKAISAAIEPLGAFAQRLEAIKKLGEIIQSLDPQCKCKIARSKTCTTTLDPVSLPLNSPTS